MNGITKTFEIHTNISPVRCPVCDESIGEYGRTGTRIDGAINHVLGHGWRLLHVGSEWGQDDAGKSIHHTVAILGETISAKYAEGRTSI